jgi:cytochrome P450
VTTAAVTADERRRAPGPRGHFLLGVLPELRRDPLSLLVSLARDHGDVVHFRAGPIDIHLVTSPAGAQHVLQDNNRNYGKQTRGFQKLRLVLGQGLLTSEGDFWRRQRRIAQPGFHRDKIRRFADTMTRATEKMLERWGSRPADKPLDVAHEMMLLTLGIVGETLLSLDTTEDSERVGAAVTLTLEHIQRRMFSAFPIVEALPLPSNLRFRRTVRYMDQLVFKVIEDRRRSGDDPDDLLSMLMHARDDQNGEGMSPGQLRDEVMTIFAAGHETTANALAWTFYLLSLSPAVARRLRAELGETLAGRAPRYDDLAHLPYTAAVVHEALRLYPPAWVISRSAIGDDVVCGYHVPAGSIVVVSPYITHRREASWPNPEGFDPDRFVDRGAGERPTGQHRFDYFPFGGGPRQCIGNGFALMEAQLVLATVAQRFELHLVPGHTIRAEPLVTLRPKGGIPMRLKRVVPPDDRARTPQ